MLRDPTESYAQRLLVTALGDYEHLSAVPIPSASLVAMMEEFEISSDATRTSLSRLVRRGYLERTKEGRHTGYRLSTIGRDLVAEAKERIERFGLPRTWDGNWTVVAFSVAENVRHIRHSLRTQLRALGFAPFYDGMWIAAYADAEGVAGQLSQIDDADVAVFRGSLLNLSATSFTKFFDTWDLEQVRADYEDFIDVFTPLAERVDSDEVPPAEAFVARTRLMDAWRVFPRSDPDLPESVLPSGWPRAQARSLFSSIYDALRPTAELRFRSLSGVRERS